ncbi:prolipoprotein diacylglyceryl transferase [Sulfurovum sp.]|uniref:prolipoprotein diacylglyceryl transferase n=1 Tax=Sulfurovum sp. TaxID=1969726 RepID=UPI0025F4649F|nr:prolipoprotein diacylglyceryl transferase [Sulfurovum sp.]
MEHFIWNVNPNILELGPLQLRWYGLLFVGSFFLGLMILQWVYKREGKDPAVLDNLLIYIMVGAVVGARLMHCFAYEPDFYLSHPLEILKVWKGGLASHGGLLGVLVALYVFAKKYNESYMWLLSRVAIPGALTAAFVRFGNLFNSEILGLPSDKPWAIIFSRVDMVPRHPVQLYEAFSYLILLLLLVAVYRKVTPAFATRILPGIFLTYMFIVRFLLEYTKTRQADYTTSLPFTTGQMLSMPFVLVGIVWIIWALKNTQKDATKG